MPIFAVTYDHPDIAGWNEHMVPHVAWLRDRLADGSLLASGPFANEATKSALLILAAVDKDALEAIIATDPFACERLIAKLTIRQWDPIFGAFNARSSMPHQSSAT